jgi:predicted kinase
MTKFIMLCGLPASGKSSYAKNLSQLENASLLSSDQMRLELYGDEGNQEHNAELFDEIYKRARRQLNKGKNVIVDATNIALKKRINALQGLDVSKEIYYFDTPLSTCVERDLLRDRTVGKRVIDRMYRQFQIPSHLEGWDKIQIVSDIDFREYTMKDELEKIITHKLSYHSLFETELSQWSIFKSIIDLPHDSPYHSFSVSKHTYYVWEYILDNYHELDKLELLWAALLHDTGKAHCKENKEGSRYSNYIGHEFVGSQLAFRFLKYIGYSDDFVLRVTELVHLHMRLMGAGDSEKAIKKLKEYTGDSLFNKLDIFYKADLQAK